MLPKNTEKTLIVMVVSMCLVFAYCIALHYTRVESILNGEVYLMDQESYMIMYGVNKDDFVSIFFAAISFLATTPFAIDGMHPLKAFIPMFCILPLFVFIWMGVDLHRRTSTSSAPGVESGSAKWNNNIPKFLKQYTTPYER